MGGEYAHIKTGINGTCAFTNGKVPVMNRINLLLRTRESKSLS